MNHLIHSNYTTLIAGKIPAMGDYGWMAEKLKWDIDENYREFAFAEKGKSGYTVFVPDDSMTLY